MNIRRITISNISENPFCRIRHDCGYISLVEHYIFSRNFAIMSFNSFLRAIIRHNLWERPKEN